MTIPKVLACLTFILFAAIAFAAWWKSDRQLEAPVASQPREQEIVLEQTIRVVEPKVLEPQVVKPIEKPKPKEADPLEVDRVEELFNITGKKLPIVETIVYKSHVPWNKGKLAWLSDYASHYHTSRHFIARSRNGKPDYLKQDLAEGDKFNVLKPDIKLQFNAIIDLNRSKMWLYYNDLDNGSKELIKTYLVGLGRSALTPSGQYLLGDRIATYKPGQFGTHNGAKVELIRIFGTRWIPFSKELGPNPGSPRGLGMHGVPWKENEKGELVEDTSSLGKFQSDGCIRLSTNDMEELYSIVITKPCVVEIVNDFSAATFPVAERE